MLTTGIRPLYSMFVRLQYTLHYQPAFQGRKPAADPAAIIITATDNLEGEKEN